MKCFFLFSLVVSLLISINRVDEMRMQWCLKNSFLSKTSRMTCWFQMNGSFFLSPSLSRFLIFFFIPNSLVCVLQWRLFVTLLPIRLLFLFRQIHVYLSNKIFFFISRTFVCVLNMSLHSSMHFTINRSLFFFHYFSYLYIHIHTHMCRSISLYLRIHNIWLR